MLWRVSTFDPLRHEHKENIFYIQSKGENAGRPLREPKRNCFIIETDYEHAFEICTVLWISKKYEPLICGSVIPFLRIRDFESMALPYIKNLSFSLTQDMKALASIDELLSHTQKKLQLVRELKISTALHVLNKFDRIIY
ncbi:DUF6943 family protein [Flavobacterium psychrotrophum]|uniref:DUF6943 family protein n=1 Tax=Flavobacterium psychrotrophum TaxID=2294119 RepID=UPI000E314F0E